MKQIQTVEQMAGQRIMAGFVGTDFNGDLKFLIDTIRVCGIILFSRNITGKTQLSLLCTEARHYAKECGLPPLLIAVDQEGGTVARLRPPDFTDIPAPPILRDANRADHFSAITAAELGEVGINMNMAPVLDVAPEGFDSVVEKRLYGRTPEKVSELGCTVIRRFQSMGIIAVAKHFPGIGRTTLDSHLLRPDFDAPPESLHAFDLLPFRAAIATRVKGIMLSHIRYTQLDPKYPASLSVEIADNLLRKNLGYHGVVMTDDLEMGAVENHYSMEEMISRIVDAQIDIALICKTRGKVETAFEALCRKLDDEASIVRSWQSVDRLMCLKTEVRL